MKARGRAVEVLTLERPERSSLNIAPKLKGENSFLLGEFLAELIGTFLLVLFGCGAVATAVLTKAQIGIWQVAVVWGFGIALAIYATRAISGAHINPAITLAMALFRRNTFPARKVIPYILAQMLGAFLAATVLYVLFTPLISSFEAANNLTRGESGSQLSAMIFGEYFPNPSLFGTSPTAWSLVPVWIAFLAEALGTAILSFFVFALTDPKNKGTPIPGISPFFIGFTVAVIISVMGPLTQAGLNPARDFGPRLLSFFAGWGKIAIPGPRGDFWVYIIGPLVGAPVGAFIYDRLIGLFLKSHLPHSRLDIFATRHFG